MDRHFPLHGARRFVVLLDVSQEEKNAKALDMLLANTFVSIDIDSSSRGKNHSL